MKRAQHRRFAAAGLYIFVMGGLLCPCHGVFLLLQKAAHAESPAKVCCSHCAEESQAPAPSPEDAPCGCPSGCCHPYLIPQEGSRTTAQAALISYQPLSQPQELPLEPAFRTVTVWVLADNPPEPFGTLLPHLSSLLI